MIISLDPNLPFYNNKQKTPEFELIQAVLESAVIDCILPRKKIESLTPLERKNQRAAIKWIFLDPIPYNPLPFSFAWICQHLFEDYQDAADTIKRKLLKYINSSKSHSYYTKRYERHQRVY